jgi:hypothetical protein
MKLRLNTPRFVELTQRLRIERPVEVKLVSETALDPIMVQRGVISSALDPDSDGRWEMQPDGSHRIYVRDGLTVKTASMVLLHEARHAHQAEVWLDAPNRQIADSIYVAASVSAEQLGRHPYRDNILEKDARRFAQRHQRTYNDLFQ